MRLTPKQTEDVIELRAKGFGPTAIACRLGIDKKQAEYAISARRKRDPEFAKACEAFPVKHGHKAAKSSKRTRRSVREQLDAGTPTPNIIQNTLASYEYVRRVETAGRTGLSVEDVPTTWAGAFRKLAEYVRDRDENAWEFARSLALAKDVKL